MAKDENAIITTLESVTVNLRIIIIIVAPKPAPTRAINAAPWNAVCPGRMIIIIPINPIIVAKILWILIFSAKNGTARSAKNRFREKPIAVTSAIGNLVKA